MKQLLLVVLFGSFSVLIFDTLASFVSRYFQLKYSLFTFGSIIIYACTGFFGAKYGNLTLAVLVSAIVGLVDSTLGWYISWIIGPGRLEIEINLKVITNAIIFVIFVASFFGLIGGLTNYLIFH